MRACLAILKDSFREAMASRILWIALLTIAVVLLSIVPVGLRTDRSLRLRQQELIDAERLLHVLADHSGEGRAVSQHLWSLMNAEQQENVRRWLAPGDGTVDRDRLDSRRTRSQRNQVLKQINGLLGNSQFYQPAAWEGVAVDDETSELLRSDSLDEADTRFRNLKLLAAAFPSSISLHDDPAMVLTYAGSDMTGPIDLLPSQLKRAMDGIIVAVLSIFLGFLGVSGSLLVTASVIPRTFEPGEISLLLSKPISRTILFLTKFAGGCAFTLLCAGLLVTGVWLILGLRLDIWRPELLWCIPVYVFLFAVYFSVSAAAGVVWKNSNVSMILVVIFWIVLFVVGTTRTLVRENVIQSRRITEITTAGDELFVVDGSGNVYRWNSDLNDWSEVFAMQSQGIPRFVRRMMMSGSRFAPVYDPANDRLLALQPEPSRFGGPAAASVVSGTGDGEWEREQEGRSPEPVIDLFLDQQGRIILPARRAIYEFVGQSEQQKKTQQFFGNLLGGLLQPSARKAFRELHKGSIPAWTPGATAALDVASGRLLILDNGSLHQFVPTDDGNYETGSVFRFKGDQPGMITAGAGFALSAFQDGTIEILELDSLNSAGQSRLMEGDVPFAVASSPDGSRLAVLSHAGRVVIYDTVTRSFSDRRLPDDGQISAIAFDQQNRLLVANNRRTVIFADQELREVDRISGTEDWVYSVYDWILNPLYTILPRPSDMDEAVRYLVTGERSVVLGESVIPTSGTDQDNLRKDRVVFDPWRPLAGNSIFIACMLTAACLYIARHDF